MAGGTTVRAAAILAVLVAAGGPLGADPLYDDLNRGGGTHDGRSTAPGAFDPTSSTGHGSPTPVRAQVQVLRPEEYGRASGTGSPVFRATDTVGVLVDLHGVDPSRAPGDVVLELEGGNGSWPARRIPGPGYQVTRYYAALRAADLGAGRPSNHRTYAAFRTTESGDAQTFRRTLRALGGAGGKLPSEEVSFHDDHQRDASSPLASLSGRELFDAGGATLRRLRVVTRERRVLATATVPLAGHADWIYYSGHYPYTSGGVLNGEVLNPWSVAGDAWDEHLEVLMVAGCYAVDINATGERATVAHGRGVHGGEWWKKFRGTLLGYRGLAPSAPHDSGIVEQFLRRVARGSANPGDAAGYSRFLATTWMNVNTHSYHSLGAAAVDASGRYFYVNTRDVNLRGVRTRNDIRWRYAEESEWGAANAALVREYHRDRKIFAAARQILWADHGGRAPDAATALRDPRLRQAAREAGLDPGSPEVTEKVRKFLDYEAHIFYDVPRPDYYQGAVTWLAQRNGGRLPTVEEVERHFTPPGNRPAARRLDRGGIAEVLFRHRAYQVATAWRRAPDGSWKLPAAAEVREALRREGLWTADRESYLHGLDRYLAAYR